MKKIVFKYTIRMARSSRPETHYAFAYTETLARRGLAEMLKVAQKIYGYQKRIYLIRFVKQFSIRKIRNIP